MNIKAERIEQILQAVNRNLNLTISGQNEVLTIELLRLDKVDAVVFGHDKFAYEMVHFVKSTINEYKEILQSTEKKTIAEYWEQSFMKGLETLLVECALVTDDIERDCFVSRVYCWFTEKLSERRELPKKVKLAAEMNSLKASLKNMNVGEGSAMKALNSFNPDNSVEASKNSNNMHLFDDKTSAIDKTTPNDRDFPIINIPDKKTKFGPRNVPVYVKHGFPSILPSKTDYTSFLPKIPGAEENYGMIYNKPETDAEKKMHELWMAKRRQEAFEYKTQQQLAIVMDRLALHKSRLESDSLRRLESIALLKERHFTADDDGTVPTKFDRFGRPIKERRSKSKSPNARSPQKSPEREKLNMNSSVIDTNVRISGNGIENEVTVAKPSRVAVIKPKQTNAPMKFKLDLPEDYMTHQNENYMQLSDSDDDDKPERGAFRQSRTGTAGGKKKGSATVAVTFKHEKPIIRERPESAKAFHSVSANDPELKVHYRYSNFRRMPMTSLQEQWVEDQETRRVKKSEEIAKKLFADGLAKAAKKKGGDKDKKDKGDKKEKGKKKKEEVVIVKPPCPYKNANHFMETNFPNFEGDDNLDAIGPMRTVQLVEVGRILGCCEDYGVKIKESSLRKALVIPQDKPEAVCLEGLKEETEGLMINPLAREFWRKFKAGGGGGKKGKKKKK